MDVTKEQIHAAMELLTTMVVESMAESEHQDASEVLPAFLSSKTGQMLYDEKLKLWCKGPSYIEDLYRKEMAG